MGYGSPGGASTFLLLKDTPETYVGQSGKLAKVNAGETALSLDLLLSFTDWYAGGAPTSYPWVFEADNPVAWGTFGALFSPIVKNAIGQYIVYVGGYDFERFYRYNLTTKQWARLADPPTAIVNCAISMSPDGSKLVATGLNQNVLRIYDVEANTWATSATAPLLSGVAPQIFGTVFADDDTVWCQVRKMAAVVVKFYKYVISTDTWTDFANSIAPAVSNTYGMSISSDGLKLYAGQLGANYYNLYRYVIATDTYTQLSLGSTGRRFIFASDRNARLWWKIEGAEVYQYYNCDTEAISGEIFPANPQEGGAYYNGGFYGLTGAIIDARADEPKNMSYFGSGMWKLVEKVLTDYNLVVFKKPADGHAILAINKVSGFTVPIYLFSTLALPAGTWEFFYPKDGDYTKLKISGSELK